MGKLNPPFLPPPNKTREIIQKRVYTRHKKDPLPSLTKDVVGNVDEQNIFLEKIRFLGIFGVCFFAVLSGNAAW
jgi:hypothetical protein